MPCGLSSLVCVWPLSVHSLIIEPTLLLIPVSHRQSVFVCLACIFFLESLLAKCVLLCMWVFKNLHDWCCAGRLRPFLALSLTLYFEGLSVLLCIHLCADSKCAQDPTLCPRLPLSPDGHQDGANSPPPPPPRRIALCMAFCGAL